MSKELFQDLLDKFKRANKERKAKLAETAGYTVEDYLAYLTAKAAGKKAPKRKSPKSETTSTTESTEELTDMVITFDSTGSMMGYINAVKDHVKTLIPTLFAQNPGLKISIVVFGDYCDMLSSTNFGKAYQVIGLTNDENALINFVNGAKNTSGGDADEFYELVIKKITEETEWRPGSNKNVLFIGDADPHKPGYRFHNMTFDIDWREEAQKAAAKGIIFDTLRIHGNAWYQELATITGGVCLPFKSSQKTAQVLEATALARGGEKTRAAFHKKSLSAEVKSDSEMTSVYAMYKEVVKK